ncbi:hypothetical protein D3H64_06865 [Atopobacter sp. AH10]|uniref:hypothetical protein n=1 Tax=Atopobacter sp. AH10 TaxID=2315861 RepID=UPI000EF251F5|nr:hypothetical protein [Atopobacter sp. AH10]RLK62936.1 hypothetical protein D3H64_06865 [Atopobacter sp. AH10]
MKQWMDFLLVMLSPIALGFMLKKLRRELEPGRFLSRAIRPLLFFTLILSIVLASYIAFRRTYLGAMFLGLSLWGLMWLGLFRLTKKEKSSLIFTKMYINSAIIILWGLHCILFMLGIVHLWQH